MYILKDINGLMYQCDTKKAEQLGIAFDDIEELIEGDEYVIDVMARIGEALGYTEDKFWSHAHWYAGIVYKLCEKQVLYNNWTYKLNLTEDAYFDTESGMYKAEGMVTDGSNWHQVEVFWSIKPDEYLRQLEESYTVTDESELCDWEYPSVVRDYRGIVLNGTFEVE